jgi:mediator of RNA polymerase II transcription subunit 23
MEQSQRSITAAAASASASSRGHQFHPARAAIIDLFNLYLGVNHRFPSYSQFYQSPPKKRKD